MASSSGHSPGQPSVPPSWRAGGPNDPPTMRSSIDRLGPIPERKPAPTGSAPGPSSSRPGTAPALWNNSSSQGAAASSKLGSQRKSPSHAAVAAAARDARQIARATAADRKLAQAMSLERARYIARAPPGRNSPPLLATDFERPTTELQALWKRREKLQEEMLLRNTPNVSHRGSTPNASHRGTPNASHRVPRLSVRSSSAPSARKGGLDSVKERASHRSSHRSTVLAIGLSPEKATSLRHGPPSERATISASERDRRPSSKAAAAVPTLPLGGGPVFDRPMETPLATATPSSKMSPDIIYGPSTGIWGVVTKEATAGPPKVLQLGSSEAKTRSPTGLPKGFSPHRMLFTERTGDEIKETTDRLADGTIHSYGEKYLQRLRMQTSPNEPIVVIMRCCHVEVMLADPKDIIKLPRARRSSSPS